MVYIYECYHKPEKVSLLYSIGAARQERLDSREAEHTYTFIPAVDQRGKYMPISPYKHGKCNNNVALIFLGLNGTDLSDARDTKKTECQRSIIHNKSKTYKSMSLSYEIHLQKLGKYIEKQKKIYNLSTL